MTDEVGGGLLYSIKGCLHKSKRLAIHDQGESLLKRKESMRDQALRDLYIQVGGIKTRYWEAGESGSPVLLIHGIGSFIEHWENNIQPLAKYHRVIALDMVGFGLTEKPALPYSVSLLTKFVRDFMKLKEIGSASVVGNSLGAMIAFELSFTNPETVEKLVLLDGGFWGRKIALAFRLLTIPVIGERLMLPRRDGTEQFLKLMFYNQSIVSEEMVNTAFELNNQAGFAKAFLATLRSGVNFLGFKRSIVQKSFENVHRVTAPTLVVWGREDNILPVEFAYKAAEILPNASLQIFEKCGHMPQIEYAEEVNNLVLSFFGSK